MEVEKLLELIKKRTSCRNYRDIPVEDDKIRICLEASRLAPSACNKQPWRFLIVKESALREKICRKGLLPGIPMPWLAKAPVIVVLCAEKNLLAHKIAPLISGIPYHFIDIGIAGEHFVLAAEAQGLGTCWIGWFREKYIKKILKIPNPVQVLSMISMGYSADDIAKPGEKLKIEEIASMNIWNGAIGLENA